MIPPIGDANLVRIGVGLAYSVLLLLYQRSILGLTGESSFLPQFSSDWARLIAFMLYIMLAALAALSTGRLLGSLV